jgi:gamma-glutamyltranspeptidase/glutathione hydrolase
MVVPGRGFLLNNELTDFNFATGTKNSPAPGKRPRSSISPTLVFKHGKPAVALRLAGGATIITTVLQTLVNEIDFGQSLPDALAAPRASQRNAAPPKDAQAGTLEKTEAEPGAAGRVAQVPSCPRMATSARRPGSASCAAAASSPWRSRRGAEAARRWW